MKITIFTTTPPNIYSGGRYLSLILAHSLARAGAHVSYITNNAPLFERDFNKYQSTWPLERIISPTFQLPDNLSSDWVIVIPTGGFDSQFYNAALRHAQSNGARLALLCFETPNWYADLSPYPRSPMPTESWRQVVASGGLVVTISSEAVGWAREYFGADRADLAFAYWHPPINDLTAESARDYLSSEDCSDQQRNRVTMFVRVEDPHKGAWDLLSLPQDLFSDHTLALIFGRGVPKTYLDALRHHFAPASNFSIESYSQITDERKFRLLGRTRLLLFPSYFEGFGYPPVEAAEMGAPTVAYDLPLLREVAGDAIRFVTRGDTAAFAAEIRAVLTEEQPLVGDSVRQMLKADPGTLHAGRSMLRILQDAEYIRPASRPPVAVPVRQNPRAELSSVRERMSPMLAGPRLAKLTASLEGRRLTAAGSVVDVPNGARLEFQVPGGCIADAVVGPADKDGWASFSTSGQFHGWPEEGASGEPAELGLTLRLARPGEKPLRLGFRTVEADWATLMMWPDGLTRVPAATEEHPRVNLFLNPELLVDHLDACSILAAVCDTCDRTGRRVRLLTYAHGTPAHCVQGVSLELLPRVHEALAGDTDALQAEITAAYQAKEPIIVGPGMADLLPKGARPLKLSARPESSKANDVLIWVPGTRGGRVYACPSPMRARRKLADQARCLTVVHTP
jgi:glycosyltransferase involved in cell wall biosynthesis